MDFKEIFLKTIYQHFDFYPLAGDKKPFYALHGGGVGQFFLNRKEAGGYESYELSSPLMVLAAHYTLDAMTVSFFDFHAQFLACEPIGPQNASHLHKHNYFELVYLVDGELDLMIEGRRYRLMPGDACMINSNVRHVELRTAEHIVIYLGIKPDFLQATLSQGPDGPKLSVLTDFFHRNRQQSGQIDYLNFNPLELFSVSPERHKFETLFTTLLQELLRQEVGYQELAQIYLLRIFAALQNPVYYLCSNTRFQVLSGTSIFERTLGYINVRRCKISRRELEEVLHYSGSYISRVFQRQIGQTLAEYIRDVCLTEAAALLLNTDMNIREICRQVGYENKTVFYDLFKEKYGVTPKQYRERKPVGDAELEELQIRKLRSSK